MLEILYPDFSGGSLNRVVGEALLIEGAELLILSGEPRRIGGWDGEMFELNSRNANDRRRHNELVIKPLDAPDGLPVEAHDAASGAFVARDERAFRLLFDSGGIRLADHLGRSARSSFDGEQWEYGSALKAERLLIGELAYLAEHPRFPEPALVHVVPGVLSRPSSLAEVGRC